MIWVMVVLPKGPQGLLAWTEASTEDPWTEVAAGLQTPWRKIETSFKVFMNDIVNVLTATENMKTHQLQE